MRDMGCIVVDDTKPGGVANTPEGCAALTSAQPG